MKKIRNVITGLLLGLSLNFANAQQDPNNLFLVEVDNIFNTASAGKVLGMPNIGDRSMSAEETLMYQVLNCRWENGKWIRYTANPNGKGTIKVGHPFLQADGNRVFFVSNIPGGAGGFDVYYSEKRNGKWSDPTNLGLKVNSSEDEFFPFITDAGVLQVYRGSTQVNFDLAEVIGATSQLTVQTPPKNTNTVTPAPVLQQPTKPIVPVAPKLETPKPAPVVQPTAPSTTIASTPKTGVEYRIQLGSYSKPNFTVLNQLNDLGSFNTIKTASGLTSVHLGSFSSLSEAQTLLKKVRLRAGFENAYVVGVENDKVVSVHK
jgi:cell division septation protein DedD